MNHHSKLEGLREWTQDMVSNSRDLARTSQDLARKGSRRARTFIYKKPMTATLIGLGVGYLLGKLFSKRKPALVVPAPGKGARRGVLSRS